jgi:hypothetical protein
MVRPLAGKALVFGFYAFLPVRAFLDQKGFFRRRTRAVFLQPASFRAARRPPRRLHHHLRPRLAAQRLALRRGRHRRVHLHRIEGDRLRPDGSDQSRVLLAPDIHTNSKFKPYFAATVHPSARSSVVGTLHFPFANTTQGENDLRFWNYTYPLGRPTRSRSTPSRRAASLCASPSAAATAAGACPMAARRGKLACSSSESAGRSTTTARASTRSTHGTTPSASRSAAAFCGASDTSPPTSATCRRRCPTRPGARTTSTTRGWWPAQASKGP